MHKSHLVTAELTQRMDYAKTNEKILLLIQEPSLNKQKDCPQLNNNFKTYYRKTFTINENNEKYPDTPRTCIFASKNLDAHMISQFSDKDQTTIAIKQNGNLVFFTSLYLPYDKVDPMTDILLSLINYCEKKKIKLYIGADANAHNINWGSSNNNDRGIKLMDAINILEMTILNIGNKPTFITENRYEIIDVSFLNKFAENTTDNWRVSITET